MHDISSRSKPGYHLLEIGTHDIRVRSLACTGLLPSGSATACTLCRHLSPCVDFVEERATRPAGRGRASLSYSQLSRKLTEVEDTLTEVKLQALNTSKSLRRLRVHRDTWRSLLHTVGTNDVPGLHRIFKNAKRQGWSLEKLLEIIKKALAGEYHPKSYSTKEIDLATVVYELGGGAALYALHRSQFAFPCQTTVLDNRTDYKLRITVGAPKMSDILANIKTMFETPPGQPTPQQVPITLSMDEVACDGRLCYLSDTDEIGGLCEHAANALPCLKMGCNLDIVRAVAQAVREGKVHVGQEVFVAAFARNDGSDYGARAVLLIPTCKQGTFIDAALIIEMLRQAWKMSPYGEVLHGPIRSIASDGDPKRRPALYVLCMTHLITPVDRLFSHVGNLRGFNLYTGSGGETIDFDFKHDFKRICKLLCAREGIVVDNTIINKNMLARWFEMMTDADWSDSTIYSLLNPGSSLAQHIHTLLSPKDAQDVPRAIKLLSLTADIRKLDTADFNPSETTTHRALSLLGEMLEALLEPFINIKLSLSEQVVRLTVFAHLACALFMKHGSAFMPFHLYSDLQCMYKTAIFRVAYARMLDPTGNVYFSLLGDDELEKLFGLVRMIGGHSPNVDVDEFRHRTGSAVRLNKIFQLYPEWELRPRRLQLKRARDVDHLGPQDWIGDLRADHCDLSQRYAEGVDEVTRLLNKYGYVQDNGRPMDFAYHFRDWVERGYDLMRPNGGKYPGISLEVDRSLGEIGRAVTEDDATEDADLGGSLAEEINLDAQYAFRSFDGRKALAEEEAQLSGCNVSLNSMWMKLEGGVLAHKKTILRLLTNPASDVDYNGSHDRLLRVRYFSIGGDHCDRAKLHHIYSISASENMFRLGCLFATLVCIDKTKTCLAVLQCTMIKYNSDMLSEIPMDEMALTDSKYEISGQILSLQPFEQQDQRSESNVWDRNSEAPTIVWIWNLNSKFVALERDKPTRSAKGRTSQKSSVTHIKHLTVTVNGQLVHPLTSSQYASATIHELQQLNPDPQSAFIFPNTLEKTWAFRECDLAEIESNLHQRVQDKEAIRAKIPVFAAVRPQAEAVTTFPYSATIDSKIAYHHFTTSISTPTSSQDSLPCTICGKPVKGCDRQNHMGHHILRRIRGVEEVFELKVQNGETPRESERIKVSLDYPCGFCGRSSMNGACSLRKGKNKGKVASDCPYAYKFMIKAAAKRSARNPSTNVPIDCIAPACTAIHWKLNMARHLHEQHPSWREHPSLTRKMRDNFCQQLAIEPEEESALGIPSHLQGRPIFVPSEFTIDVRRGRTPAPTSFDPHGDSPRRPRYFQSSPTDRPYIPFSLPSSSTTSAIALAPVPIASGASEVHIDTKWQEFQSDSIDTSFLDGGFSTQYNLVGSNKHVYHP